MREYVERRSTDVTTAAILASSYISAEQANTTSPPPVAHRKASYARRLGFGGVVMITGLCMSGPDVESLVSADSIAPVAAFVPHAWGEQAPEEEQVEVQSYAQLSDELQREFGFTKVAHWARILKVERKTIYDWRKRPKTEVQPRIVERLMALKALREEMEPEHREFVSTMAFGRWADQSFAAALVGASLDSGELTQHYDSLFLDFVGLDKRSRLERT